MKRGSTWMSLRPSVHGLGDPLEGNGMILGGIGADDQDDSQHSERRSSGWSWPLGRSSPPDWRRWSYVRDGRSVPYRRGPEHGPSCTAGSTLRCLVRPPPRLAMASVRPAESFQVLSRVAFTLRAMVSIIQSHDFSSQSRRAWGPVQWLGKPVGVESCRSPGGSGPSPALWDKANPD